MHFELLKLTLHSSVLELCDMLLNESVAFLASFFICTFEVFWNEVISIIIINSRYCGLSCHLQQEFTEDCSQVATTHSRSCNIAFRLLISKIVVLIKIIKESLNCSESCFLFFVINGKLQEKKKHQTFANPSFSCFFS